MSLLGPLHLLNMIPATHYKYKNKVRKITHPKPHKNLAQYLLVIGIIYANPNFKPTRGGYMEGVDP